MTVMNTDPMDLLIPRILVVDDERQIHAAVRLRLGKEYEMVSSFDPRDALEKVRQERFDLCFTDLHMPHMDGFTFVEQARNVDPALGYIILSAFDTDENLRRAIPLQVFEFLGKPLPEREGFEHRLPEWVERTRRQRRDLQLAEASRSVAQELASAQLAHEVEVVASETARDALLQAANLLTTVHAHLVTAATLLATRVKLDPSISHVLRNIEEGRKVADAAVSVTEGYFNSAYANRDSSPAYVNGGIRRAIEIAGRISLADTNNKRVDFSAVDDRIVIQGLSGIDLLLLLIPTISATLTCAQSASTVRIHCNTVSRLDVLLKDSAHRDFFWLKRKHVLVSRAGIQVTLTATGRGVSRGEIESWLKGSASPLASLSPRGLVRGLEKSHGILGCSPPPPTNGAFRLVLGLPI